MTQPTLGMPVLYRAPKEGSEWKAAIVVQEVPLELAVFDNGAKTYSVYPMAEGHGPGCWKLPHYLLELEQLAVLGC